MKVIYEADSAEIFEHLHLGANIILSRTSSAMSLG